MVEGVHLLKVKYMDSIHPTCVCSIYYIDSEGGKKRMNVDLRPINKAERAKIEKELVLNDIETKGL